MKISNSIYTPKNLEELANDIKKKLEEKNKSGKLNKLSKKLFKKKSKIL